MTPTDDRAEERGHTAGPWYVDRMIFADETIGFFIRYKEDEDEKPICVARFDFGGPDNAQELEANARLIAAAPDLLAVAARMVLDADNFARSFGVDRMHENAGSLIADARAAIAKATGAAS